MGEAFLLTRALLQFGDTRDDLRGDLSAAAITPDGSLWVASDELHSVERLSQVAPYVFDAHRPFPLGTFVPLPDPEGEVDIEGMDYHDSYIWLVGSHSLKRKKVKGKQTAKDIGRLATVKPEPNRFLLARILVVGDMLFTSCSHPERPETLLTAAHLELRDEGNVLTEALSEDEHLGPFLSFPLGDKENGFNIEGLAARGNRLFLGLRGPVLDGWAILLELELAEGQPGVLTLQQADGWARPYRKHFLNLDGLGIRELQLHGDDLLILAGPTMHVEGAMQLYRLNDALGHDDDSLSSRDTGDLCPVFDLPFTIGADHAEGLACLPCLGADAALMVLYHTP
ncbi:MAG TPA: DUF3616 domain-containing protein, partial [Chloroflexaceae bacterium]|nr:DUF3616 domain-containing protein [Chloroflexaceae bacterium]